MQRCGRAEVGQGQDCLHTAIQQGEEACHSNWIQNAVLKSLLLKIRLLNIRTKMVCMCVDLLVCSGNCYICTRAHVYHNCDWS